ncbi:FHA domain-containing protein [Conexibacter sp. JD483]|uniref:FHA domain-containing protein n=1 Tax=unclassified Conexibacter TaxID=2627773 RepID=UPI002726BABD|nr:MULTISPECIES: FHA domain-containing protein [unclassified Conexibacter]MDO8186299.1 FHA domain-containing protein [Conexibacter sp. CPCC 205706]MDO8197504.1 FHA domain-containing protein [Conexibacter sp. CPCC 205762]MDR9370287.1 FHA domain-containing protein [Conexibacter sp. JD483]
MTTTPTEHTTAFEPTVAIDALQSTTGGERVTGAARPEPGRYFTIQEDHGERLLPLERAITHLGRGFTADIQLEDVSVSRRHAIVTQRRGAVRILDDRSSNGTFVNGRRIQEAELRHGDVVVIGRVVLQYVDVPG